MIIPKEELSADDVRMGVERFLQEQLNWTIDGYKCDSSTVIQVLVKAASDGQSIDSICEDLRSSVSSNMVRMQLNAILDVYDLRLRPAQINVGLVACIPEAMPRLGQEKALDLRGEPFESFQNIR